MDAERSQVPIFRLAGCEFLFPPEEKHNLVCTKNILQYAGVSFFQARGYLPLNLFFPILKYIIVLIQTTVLYTT